MSALRSRAPMARPVLAGPRGADKNDIVGGCDKGELGQLHDLFFIDGGLVFEREAFKGPVEGGF